MNARQTAIAAAKAAGQEILKLYRKKIRFTAKGSRDILTEADLRSEKIILNTIGKNFPSHNIFSEEAGDKHITSPFLWIIDPLDGSINYSRKLDEFCISIALEHNGDLVLGVLFDPLHNKLYLAEKNKGAFLNGRRLHVSKETILANSLACTDVSHSLDNRIINFQKLARLATEFRHIRILGSGGLHLAKIAEGKLDCYFKTKFNYWDYAAGALLVTEAGGKVTDFEGKKIGRNTKNIAASNKFLHSKFLKLLAAANS